MSARLSEHDRARVRYHLGYLNTEPSASIQLGFPRASQALFLVDQAMDRLIPAAVQKAMQLLDRLETVECQMFEANKRLKAVQIDNLTLRRSNDERNEQDMLRSEYLHWASALADLLGVALNVYSHRFRGGGDASGTIPVVHEV